MSVVEPLSGPPKILALGERTADMAAALARGPLRPVALAPTRRRISGSTAARSFRLLDGVIVFGCLVGWSGLAGGSLLTAPFAKVLPQLIGAWLAAALLGAAKAYTFGPRQTLTPHLFRVFAAVLIASLGARLLATLVQAPPAAVWEWSALTTTAMLAAHVVWWLRVRSWRAAGRMTPNIVVVGATENAQKLIEAALGSREIAVLGVFDDRLSRSPDAVCGVPVLGDTAALLAHPLLPYVDRIVITVAPWAQSRVRDLIDRLSLLPNAVTLFMDVDEAGARQSALHRLAAGGVGGGSASEQDERRAFAKRLQDLIIGGVALLVFAPVMAIVALAVAVDSPGPVFFRQRRHGFNNEAIIVWKFRSMRTDAADATASRQVSKDDDRVTRVGRLIRKLSLDELPQLFNVMTGEMSLVGPRPHAIGMKTAGEDSARLVAEYAWRHRMKPGLTGWAQVNGSIGAVDTAEAVRRRVALDVEYIESQSFWMDLYILAMTVPALVRARNVAR